MANSLKNHLYAIISGKSEVRHGKIIQTIANYLRESQRTSTTFKGSKHYKEQEKQKLESYISKNQLWVKHIDFDLYVSEGAEQKVYLKDQKSVIKLNDSIDYFNSRPESSRIGAIISNQSQVIPSRKYIDDKLNNFIINSETMAKPLNWGGYNVVPKSIEFWQGRDNRLHDRIIFSNESKKWNFKRLSP